LAVFYYTEIHELIGQPSWIDVIVDGKRSNILLHSLLAWDYLCHVLRTTHNSIIFVNPQYRLGPTVFCDAAENPMTVQIFVLLEQQDL
jgi:hypothetical protein